MKKDLGYGYYVNDFEEYKNKIKELMLGSFINNKKRIFLLKEKNNQYKQTKFSLFEDILKEEGVDLI
jgi:hypothetical protein